MGERRTHMPEDEAARWEQTHLCLDEAEAFERRQRWSERAGRCWNWAGTSLLAEPTRCFRWTLDLTNKCMPECLYMKILGALNHQILNGLPFGGVSCPPDSLAYAFG